jgi:hypothetical protein
MFQAVDFLNIFLAVCSGQDPVRPFWQYGNELLGMLGGHVLTTWLTTIFSRSVLRRVCKGLVELYALHVWSFRLSTCSVVCKTDVDFFPSCWFSIAWCCYRLSPLQCGASVSTVSWQRNSSLTGNILFDPLKPKPVKISRNLVHTAKKTLLFTTTNFLWLVLCEEINPVYTEDHTKPTNTKCSVTDC